MTFRSASVLGAAAAAAALLAGCGGGSGSSSSGGAYGGGSAKPTATTTTASARAAAGAPLALTADESSGLAFSPKTLTAKAGTVTLKLDNPGANSLPHAISVEGQGVDQAGTIAQPGATSSVTVKLKPGVYTFYCPVDSHRAQGMEGRLTVR
jgi:plastocyanin